MLSSTLSSVEGCRFSGESMQNRILRRAQDAAAPKNERTPALHRRGFSSSNRLFSRKVLAGPGVKEDFSGILG
jgi:hypothetical protein